MAKYLAMSLAMLNVVSEPRVISICLPVSTTSISLVGLLSKSTILPASLAACVPLFMATATSACASAGASLVPSPVMATSLPSLWCWRMRASFASGVASARKSSTPASAAMAAAVRRLSPVTITVLMPMRRSSAKRSLMPPLTMSFNSTAPSTVAPSLTTSGVEPRRAMLSTMSCRLCGQGVPCSCMWRLMASAAPLRMLRPCQSMPLMRVCAVKRTNCAPSVSISRPRWFKTCLAKLTMERPSGVSSASDDKSAACANVLSLMFSAGIKADACLLPSVIVPVLSSSSTSTSPAASTALPDVAMTFFSIMRPMPATPIAESKPPMVVGIRQTSSAISTVTVTGEPCPLARTLKMEKGSRVAVAIKNVSVSATSKIVSAISLGLFLRLAPSTMPIMRSKKVSPGLVMICTTSQSDSTRVPPVTAQKSPPDSRITGADSPVMADSSTEATPSITSPSPGTVSPASISTTSPLRSSCDWVCTTVAP